MKPYVYQSVTEQEVVGVFAAAYDGLIHAIGIGSSGSVCKHWVMDKQDFGLIKDIPKPVMAVWKEPITTLPAQFIGVKPPNSDFDSMVALNDELVLCYKGKNRQHLFQSYFQIAELVSNKCSSLIFFWSLNDCIYLTLFDSGKLLYSNVLEVSGNEEVIYFILSIAKDCGFDAKTFTLMGDASDHVMYELQLEFEKLSIDLVRLNRESLYEGSQNSPDAHVAHLLLLIGGCEFPRDY